jgi:hypothetical protein
MQAKTKIVVVLKLIQLWKKKEPQLRDNTNLYFSKKNYFLLEASPKQTCFKLKAQLIQDKVTLLKQKKEIMLGIHHTWIMEIWIKKEN